MSPVLLFLAVVAAPAAPDSLLGRITDLDGQAIAGARVDIWTGRPKVGVGTL
ncbi:MAG: hypothetical protein H6821_15180 [Planctomycetaceae bacterium]|nr:hypothetical protein [Planctomycetaceae bacterium]MCB9939997.1 hypothetical protein [Planctomycetaceae bacterium]HRX80245.1 hypothetical protein [Pirellulaceae bacterium]